MIFRRATPAARCLWRVDRPSGPALAGGLAAVALLAGGAAPRAHAAEQLLETLTAPGGGAPLQSATQLRQGATYRLVVTGFVFFHYGPPTVPSARTEVHDAQYCWSVTGYVYPGELCLEGAPTGPLPTGALQFGGAAGPLRPLNGLAGRTLPYRPHSQDPSHRYEVAFVAAAGGALLVRPNTFTGATGASGQFTAQLFGEAPPSPPPVAPAPGTPCPDQTAAALGGATADQLCPEEPPTCSGRKATIFPDPANPLPIPLFGTPGDDVIVGSPGEDLVFGRGGKDQICGLSGDDVLAGNAGEDVIYGGPDNDRLLGGDDGADDFLSGQEGNDRHVGGPGSDVMAGGTGADTFIGGPGGDQVSYVSLPGPVRVDLQPGAGRGRTA